MMYQVIYIPRIENEICVGEYKTQMEAERHMKRIKTELQEFHYIKVVNDDESISYRRDD
tara:strand:- start:531 stop:707 length:177 start_codon:yes stop_codon:yes gene_type:complete